MNVKTTNTIRLCTLGNIVHQQDFTCNGQSIKGTLNQFLKCSEICTVVIIWVCLLFTRSIIINFIFTTYTITVDDVC